MTFKQPIVPYYRAFLVGALFLAGLVPAAENRNGFDYSDALVPPKEILWGGVPRDGIPPIHNPKFVDAEDASFLRDKDRVLGVARNGIAKAYPIRIMDRHEVVNDRFGEEPIVVTYCPLCFSGMAFEADFDGDELAFGVSGLLYNSDVLLYDYRTGSLWSQIMSKSISGPMKGTEIPAVATAHTTWRDWQERHPDTLVLSRDTGFGTRYNSSPYADYQSTSRLMFPVARHNGAYRNKERVLGLTINGVDKAYPFKELRKNSQASFTDIVGGEELTIEWDNREAYARVLDASGEEVPTVIVYWFAWYAFHPTTSVFPTIAPSMERLVPQPARP